MIFALGESLTDVTQLNPPASYPAPLKRVYLQDSHLIWSTLFHFPEFPVCHPIVEFHELSTYVHFKFLAEKKLRMLRYILFIIVVFQKI